MKSHLNGKVVGLEKVDISVKNLGGGKGGGLESDVTSFSLSLETIMQIKSWMGYHGDSKKCCRLFRALLHGGIRNTVEPLYNVIFGTGQKVTL